MNDEKQYLFTANGSYFGHCIVALAFVLPIAYGIVDRGCIDLNEANVLMFPLGVALLLVFAAITEACMMIKGKRHLFAYNVDKAICVSLDNIKLNAAISIARKLYGPVFDGDCAQYFSLRPKSPCLRNLFYAIVIVMFILSLVSPCHHIINAAQNGMLPTKVIVAWVFIVFDGIMIVNRLFFRASIRRFWAFTLGDANFCSILRFELSGEDAVEQPPFVVDSLEDENQQD